MLIINKIDLAAYVERTIPELDTRTANLDLMMEDDRPLLFHSRRKLDWMKWSE